MLTDYERAVLAAQLDDVRWQVDALVNVVRRRISRVAAAIEGRPVPHRPTSPER
jgi:hypothetical protein